MATDKRQFTMRMQPENFDKIRVIAALNKRSMAMQIEYLLEKCIAEYESSHGVINLFENEKRHNVIQENSGGTNFLVTGGKNNYGIVTS